MAPRAKLLAKLPADRYRTSLPGGRAPQVGDEVILDQGFTSADGLPMVLVYFPAWSRRNQYSADVYESELGPDLETKWWQLWRWTLGPDA
jgi:hypothetical protein